MDDLASIQELLNKLSLRVRNLEDLVQSQIQRIHALEKTLAGDSGFEPSPPGLSLEESSPPPLPELVRSPSLQAQGASPPAPAVSAPEEPSVVAGLEARIGGSWLNKIGVTAIVLGMGYFLKYAIENEWIGEMGRVVLGIATGLGFLWWGELLHKRGFRNYGLTVSAGGIAVLYLSVFAAFQLYVLLPQLAAFLLMFLITVTAVAMAVRYDSRTVAFLGIVGGFLTPAMLSTGRDNQIGLFCYILILDLGVLGLAYFKNWRKLNLLALVFTHVLFLAWASSFYSQEKLWRTEAFLTVFFLVFALLAFLYNLVHQEKSSFADLALISLNGSSYFLWTYGLLEGKYFHLLGFFALLMAAAYTGLASFLRKRAEQDTYLFLVTLGLGLTFITLAIPIQLKQNWITIGWSMEAVVLTVIGLRLNEKRTRLAALLILALVSLRLLFYDQPGFLNQNVLWFLNRRGLTFAVAVGAILTVALLFARHRDAGLALAATTETGPGNVLEHRLIAGLVLGANLLLLFFLTTEIAAYFDAWNYRISSYTLKREVASQKQLAISALWAFYSIFLVTIGIVRRYQPLRLLAIVLFGVTILKVFLVDLSEVERIYRVISFIGLGIVLLAVSFMYQKYQKQINQFVMK
ncbi:MAG: DUF2339 domain-containing protein [Acidobacteriota bacterium]